MDEKKQKDKAPAASGGQQKQQTGGKPSKGLRDVHFTRTQDISKDTKSKI